MERPGHARRLAPGRCGAAHAAAGADAVQPLGRDGVAAAHRLEHPAHARQRSRHLLQRGGDSHQPGPARRAGRARVVELPAVCATRQLVDGAMDDAARRRADVDAVAQHLPRCRRRLDRAPRAGAPLYSRGRTGGARRARSDPAGAGGHRRLDLGRQGTFACTAARARGDLAILRVARLPGCDARAARAALAARARDAGRYSRDEATGRTVPAGVGEAARGRGGRHLPRQLCAGRGAHRVRRCVPRSSGLPARGARA
mmetsp:Transcript_203/g.668  ORF Transcript_203/g.668 Transcript_203/m.668 type:complete len:257 (+) Transcript_203:720-1490(+)